MKNQAWLEILLITLVTGFIMLFNLGSLPLLDPDEPVYAETAKEMLLTNDWLSPRIYGEFWYDKPPMYYWLVATAFRFWGTNEFAARLPSALLAIGGTLLIYSAGRKLFTPRAGRLAALVLATSLEYCYLGKAAVTDMTLTFFLTAALLSLLTSRYSLAAICAALAVITKGPIGLIFPVAIYVLYRLAAKSPARPPKILLLRGLLLFSAIALPWYFFMYAVHGRDFINTFLGFHNFTRFLQPEHPDGRLWYYYLPVLLVGFFPWTAFLFPAGRAAWQERTAPGTKALRFLMLWISVIFGFFTLSQTKLVSYILPVFPPLALLIGWYLDKIMTAGNFRPFRQAVIILAILMIFLGGVMVNNAQMPGQLPELIITGMIFLTILAGSWLAAGRQRIKLFFTAFAGGTACFLVLLMTSLFPVNAQNLSTRDLAVFFSRHYDGHTTIYVEKFYHPSFTFYTGIAGREIKTNQQAAQAIASEDHALLLLREKSYASLPPGLRANLIILYRQNDKILLQKTVGNQLPDPLSAPDQLYTKLY